MFPREKEGCLQLSRPHQSSSLEVLSSRAPHVFFVLSGFEGMVSSPGSLRYCPRVSLLPHLYSPPGPRVVHRDGEEAFLLQKLDPLLWFLVELLCASDEKLEKY